MNVYIAAPASMASGGPELLHQLAAELRKQSFNAYMYYYGEYEQSPVHSNYIQYQIPYTVTMDGIDLAGNCFIVPEPTVSVLESMKYCRKIIWWLSIDFFFENNSMSDGLKLAKMDYLHFVQSEFARNYIHTIFGIKEERIFYLSDYLREDFVEAVEYKRENIVLYNPKKGYEITKYLIEQAPDIQFIPLIHMTPAQVGEHLRTAKMYIDFGNHPGKDRIPREAALSGCCVITGMNGSAAYYKDVPIPDKYKFHDGIKQAEEIIEMIRDVFSNYEKVNIDFDSYRAVIRNEKDAFMKDVENIFNVFLEQEKHLVSVVLPTFNRQNVLERAIDSVLNQTYSNLELIIIDDGSTDGTEELIHRYQEIDQRVVYYKNAVNSGPHVSRNLGILKSRGDYIAFQDSDDEWVLDKLFKQMSLFLQTEENIGMVYSPFIKIASEELKICPNPDEVEKWSGELLETLFSTPLCGTPTMLIKRSVLNEVGKFDEKLNCLEDYELSLRIAKKYLIYAVMEPLLLSYTSGDGINSNMLEALKTRCFILKEFRDDYLKYGLFEKVSASIIRDSIKIGQQQVIAKMLAEALL
ncbi:MAG: glycosyltransferase family A protein [Lachnospiraceae bacterium]|nr:glycosyltransferase family A protein [Lachnospiraceae bacterium]